MIFRLCTFQQATVALSPRLVSPAPFSGKLTQRFPRLPTFPSQAGPQFQFSYKMSTSISSMAQRLSGKTILITGASSGIGQSTAVEFARTAPDCNLILTARREENLKHLAEQIKKMTNGKTEVLTIKLDVSKTDEVKGLLDRIPEKWREVDILINNAGLVKGAEAVGNIAEEDIEVMFRTNVHGLLAMTQLILPGMVKRDSGSIINIGSIAGRDGYAGGSVYCATKAAVRSITESLRKELIATRVRVMEIQPGQVETEFSIVRFRGDKVAADAVYTGCEPLRPDDIAEIIVFMAGRRENVVIAEAMVYPNHQASATILHKKKT